ncbi:MAG: hypothetical protein JST04_05090 [Bdellovibrionales bacterium]|nr:hypothetical protein [Bdellovibrionales bacterium]
MGFLKLNRFAVLIAGIVLATAAFADETAPTSDVPSPTIEAAPKIPRRAGRSRAAVATKRRRVNLGEPPVDPRMPPAGSAATGVTSSSPAGAPTTPYGGSD